jgi:hypothetical protein
MNDIPAKRAAVWPRIAIAVVCALGVYFAVAYLLMPLFWVSYAPIHPALDEVPNITLTGDDHPGDPLNVALIGSQEDVQRAMKAAGWFPADPLGLRSDLKIAADTVLKRPYDEAPVSSLYLFGRQEDLAFEQPVGHDPSRRHHVRFWKAPTADAQGRPLWIGAATYDERVGLSHTTGQITHHISGAVDQERDHVLQTLRASGEPVSVQLLPNFHATRTGKNGGGDVWQTDGSLGVAIFK